MILDDVMRCCMNEYTSTVGQYEFFDSCKARMVLLPQRALSSQGKRVLFLRNFLP